MTPIADALTALRTPNDIDVLEEASWAYIAQYVPTPELLAATRERARVLAGKPTDWYTLKAIRTDNGST